MNRPALKILLAAAAILLGLPQTSAAAEKAALNLMIPMRDGIRLATDVYLPPEGDGPWPVLLNRTPYDKGEANPFPQATAAGYAVVSQDCRGRFASEGEFYPYLNESEDGYDTCEWAASQSWSNGRVGTFGGSYEGVTQFLLALARPPHLAAMAPSVTGSDYYEGWTYRGGALRLYFAVTWALGLARTGMLRLRPGEGPDPETVRAIMDGRADMKAGFYQLPLDRFQPLLDSGTAGYFFDWLEHPIEDDYWTRWRISDHYDDINVPVLHIAAWYDLFLDGSLRNFTELDRLRDDQELIIGLGGHAGGFESTKYGTVDFGPDAAMDMSAAQLAFFDRWLKGRKVDPAPTVRYFLMGANGWRTAETWPLKNARPTEYFLHSKGRAGRLMLDGSLGSAAPATEPPDAFVYDPDHPVPTIGGALCCSPTIPNGPQDQRPVEIRPDVLVYSSPPLEKPVQIAGPVEVVLYAATSAVDTDFTAKLVDIHPDGFAQNLADGIVRARFRNSAAGEKPIQPGEVYQYRITLNQTANLFGNGHRIRLEISSSNFPCYDRNLNSGGPLFSSTESLPARQTVFHDREHPSRMVLYLVETAR